MPSCEAARWALSQGGSATATKPAQPTIAPRVGELPLLSGSPRTCLTLRSAALARGLLQGRPRQRVWLTRRHDRPQVGRLPPYALVRRRSPIKRAVPP